MTVKDALATAGMRSTGGAIELTDHVPSEDAASVAHARMPVPSSGANRTAVGQATFKPSTKCLDELVTRGTSAGHPGVHRVVLLQPLRHA